MAVLTRGAFGSSGKKGVSPLGVSCITAVATLAAGLAVVVMGRVEAKRVRGRRREAVRRNAIVRRPEVMKRLECG